MLIFSKTVSILSTMPLVYDLQMCVHLSTIITKDQTDKQKCAWVARNATAINCAVEGIQFLYPVTCGNYFHKLSITILEIYLITVRYKDRYKEKG
jgi:hypothetical protein